MKSNLPSNCRAMPSLRGEIPSTLTKIRQGDKNIPQSIIPRPIYKIYDVVQPNTNDELSPREVIAQIRADVHEEQINTRTLAGRSTLYANYINFVEAFVTLLSKTDDSVVLGPAPRNTLQPCFKPRTDQKRLEWLYRMGVFNVEDISTHRNRMRFSEKMELFLEVMDMYRENLEIHGCKPDNHSQAEESSRRVMLNGIIRAIRKRSKEKVFRQKLARRTEKAKRNLLSMHHLTDQLFKHHTRLLVIRLDLSFKKSIEEFKHFSHFDPLEDLQNVLECRGSLINNMRHKPQIFEKCVGYIMKIEQGFEGGCHIHCVFYFDGSKARSDYTHAHAIGEYWAKEITKGKGSFYNCNAVKNEYKRLGIGMIEHTDEEKISVLKNHVLGYLAKKTQYIMIMPLHRIDAFTRSSAPKDFKNKTKPGRIRNSVKASQKVDSVSASPQDNQPIVFTNLPNGFGRWK